MILSRFAVGLVFTAMAVLLPMCVVSDIYADSEISLRKEREEELRAEAELCGRIVCSPEAEYEVLRTVLDDDDPGLTSGAEDWTEPDCAPAFLRRITVITDTRIREEAEQNGYFVLEASDRVRVRLKL